ncbi:MAG TPA: energy transducer TonB, partial [Edaphobacter sp.]|nr:energy transducer TonB [Edaphobacter sp.]
GARNGAMVMRVIVDREGKVRSVDDFFSDNPGLQQAAQEQIMQWRFRPYLDHGVPVQVISTLTFPFALK